MQKNIYKYFGPSLAPLVLKDDGATLKFTRPKDFNDPYELFLTIDYSVEASALAAYQELVGRIPQLPTSCFSSSPAIPPMWAHYGLNGTGFAVEFEEDAIEGEFQTSSFGDVSYQDQADEGLTEMLYRAHVIGKPRYTYFLQSGVMHAAYFTKATCWSYELERRMVLRDYAEDAGDDQLILIDVPKHCVRSIIAGPASSKELQDLLKERATTLGCRYLKANIGKSSIKPFFVDEDGVPHFFDGEKITDATNSCESCSEPLDDGPEKCSWCQITEDHRREAAMRNPYRIIQMYGGLEDYIKSMDDITAMRFQK